MRISCRARGPARDRAGPGAGDREVPAAATSPLHAPGAGPGFQDSRMGGSPSHGQDRGLPPLVHAANAKHTQRWPSPAPGSQVGGPPRTPSGPVAWAATRGTAPAQRRRAGHRAGGRTPGDGDLQSAQSLCTVPHDRPAREQRTSLPGSSGMTCSSRYPRHATAACQQGRLADPNHGLKISRIATNGALDFTAVGVVVMTGWAVRQTITACNSTSAPKADEATPPGIIPALGHRRCQEVTHLAKPWQTHCRDGSCA